VSINGCSTAVALSSGQDGAPTKVVGISLDIDAQKRMEMDLRESEQRFRGAFEFAAIGMALVAPTAAVTSQPVPVRIVGYTPERTARHRLSIHHRTPKI